MNKQNIKFIENHEEIVYDLNFQESFFVINIDHHHDWAYLNGLRELNCGNWVKHIDDNYNLLKYIWVHDTNSFFPNELNSKIISYHIDCIELWNNFIPDYFYICLSPQWVPPYVEPLYDLWKNLYNNKENFYV